jgi:hypothetical protein
MRLLKLFTVDILTFCAWLLLFLIMGLGFALISSSLFSTAFPLAGLVYGILGWLAGDAVRPVYLWLREQFHVDQS